MPITAPRALAALVLLAASPVHANDGPIGWKLAPAKSAETLQLSLIRERPGSRSMHSSSIAAASLIGLPADALRHDTGPVSFRLSREAGVFDCRGATQRGRGEGVCDYGRRPDFDAEIARYGLARPTEMQSYQLAALDAHVETLAALRRLGFRQPTVDQWLALTVHRADAGWLKGVAEAGRQHDGLDDLVAYRIHGVTGDWLKGLAAADRDLARASAGDVVAMRIHGVTPVWVDGLVKAGLRNASAPEFTAMRIHGITPEFVRAALGAGVEPNSSSVIGRKLRGGVS